MSHTAWDNVKQRYLKAANILGLEDQIISELLSFKNKWAVDLEATVAGKPVRLEAIRVWHRAPLTEAIFKGGNRFLLGTNLESLKSHAAEMSIKCWIHDLPYGGAKGGVNVDPRQCSATELKGIAEKFVDELDERAAIGPFIDVGAPDVNTNPLTMFFMAQRYAYRHRGEAYANGVVTGKPVFGRSERVGGIRGRNEATGYGLIRALEYFQGKLFVLGNEPTMILQGFGNVGMHAALFAKQMGFRIVGVCDELGGAYNPHGIDIEKLYAYWRGRSPCSVAGYPEGEAVDPKALLEYECDVLVPAALEEVITPENAPRIKAPVILEGANGPTTPEADEILEARGVVVIPDVLANSGGVTVSFFEWGRNTDQSDIRIPQENNREQVLAAMTKMMLSAGHGLLEQREKHKVSPRLAAYILALEKIELLRARRMPDYAKKLFG